MKTLGRTISELSKSLGWSVQKIRGMCLKYENDGYYKRKGKRNREDIWFVTPKGIKRLNKIRGKERTVKNR